MLHPTVPNAPPPAKFSCTQAMTLAILRVTFGTRVAGADVRVNQPQPEKPHAHRTMTTLASEASSIRLDRLVMYKVPPPPVCSSTVLLPFCRVVNARWPPMPSTTKATDCLVASPPSGTWQSCQLAHGSLHR